MLLQSTDSIGNTDADTWISIAVAVGMILAVGMMVLAVEHFRPRSGPMLVNMETGERLRLNPREGEAVQLGGAVVRCGKGRFYLQSQGDTPVLLNGQPVRAARLIHGDQLVVDEETFRFQQQGKGQV